MCVCACNVSVCMQCCVCMCVHVRARVCAMHAAIPAVFLQALRYQMWERQRERRLVWSRKKNHTVNLGHHLYHVQFITRYQKVS